MKLAQLVLLTACLCHAGGIRVLVRDPSGAAIANAEVRAGHSILRTDGAGSASFVDLPAGRIDILVRAEGFELWQTYVNVRATGMTTVEHALGLARHSDQVQVGADRQDEALDPRNLGTMLLGPNEIEQLPDDPEEMEKMLKEMAGPGAVVRINGFRGGHMPHKSQIASIRFRLTAYSAEEHDDGFMVIDVVTKAGIGEWHGDGSFSFGDDSMNARNAFARTREPQQARRIDLNLGGPLRKDKTSGNFSFSRSDGYDPRIVSGFVPSGPFSDTLKLPLLNTNFSGRVQHNLTRSQVLRVEYLGERTERTTAGSFDLPERRASTFNEDHQLRLNMTGSITERLVNEARFQADWIRTGNGSLTQLPTVIVQGAFNSGGANVDSDRNARTFELTDHLSFNHRKHMMRAGIQLDHLRYRGRDFTNGLGTTIYPSLAAYLANEPAQLSRRSAEVTVGYHQTRWAGYFQDDIRARRNLSLSFGLRREGMTQVQALTIPAGRVGFAWSPFKSGKMTVRGGAGIFNQWYDASLYEETLRLNGASQVDLITSPFGSRLPGMIRADPQLRMPYTLRTSLGIQRQLPGALNLMVDWRHEHGVNLFRSRNLNTPGSGCGYLLQFENGASSRQNGLLVSVGALPSPDAKGFRSRVFWNTHYFLSKATDEVTNPLTPPVNSLNARADRGPTTFDVRHRFSTMGQITLPHAVQIGSFFSASSAMPYNVTTGFDNNADTFFNDRPGGVERNSMRGAGQINLSSRISWTRGFGTRRSGEAGSPTMIRMRLDGSGGMPDLGMGRAARANALVRMQLYASATNVLNHTNPSGFIGIATSLLFGQPSMAQPPRRLEIGVRFGF